MKTSPRRTALFLLISALLTLSGVSCNTFRGFGRDVSHAGHHIEHAAR